MRLSRDIPEPPPTEYAKQGTGAHMLAEICLRSGNEPAQYIDSIMPTEDGDVLVTEAMADAVKIYVDFCRKLIESADEFWIERKFDLELLQPPDPMFGTSDFAAYNRDERVLDVCDFKFGQGVLVEVVDNPQLLYYALGVILGHTAGAVDHIRLHVVQPRAAHADGAIRTFEIPIEELTAFAAKLLEGARRTQEADAPLKAGAHCRFCPAAAICPEQLAHAQLVAQTDFEVMPYRPPAPSALTTEQLAEFLPKLDIIEDWISAVRQHAKTLLEKGEHVPGAKLVEKRAQRKWIDEGDVASVLRFKKGYDLDQIGEWSLNSPAQIEKLLGKKAFAALLSEHVEKKSSGLVMVAADDPRPAVLVSAGEEFLALPSGE